MLWCTMLYVTHDSSPLAHLSAYWNVISPHVTYRSTPSLVYTKVDSCPYYVPAHTWQLCITVLWRHIATSKHHCLNWSGMFLLSVVPITTSDRGGEEVSLPLWRTTAPIMTYSLLLHIVWATLHATWASIPLTATLVCCIPPLVNWMAMNNWDAMCSCFHRLHTL